VTLRFTKKGTSDKGEPGQVFTSALSSLSGECGMCADADAKRRNGRYLTASISRDGIKRLDKKEW